MLDEAAQVEGLEEKEDAVGTQGVVDLLRELLDQERDRHENRRVVDAHVLGGGAEGAHELEPRMERKRDDEVGGEGKGVEERQDDEEAVVAPEEGDGLGCAGGVDHEVGMGEEGALWRAGCARGVYDGADVVLGDLGGGIAAGVGEGAFAVDVETLLNGDARAAADEGGGLALAVVEEHGLHKRQARQDGLKQREVRGVGHNGAGLGVGEDVGDLGGAQLGIHRDDGCGGA